MKERVVLLAVVVGLAVLAGIHVAGWVMTTAPVHSVPPPVHGVPVPGAPATKVARAQRLLRALVTRENLPGASAAVAVGGRIVWAEAVGWADLERRVPLTPATRLRIGALTEALTSVVVGRLAERGVLDLDAPVGRYLPGLGGGPLSAVSTRQLLAHVAGVRRHHGEDNGIRLWNCADITDGLDAIAGEPLDSGPGTRFAYSAWNYVVASRLAEAVTGSPFSDVLRRELLEPLSLRDTEVDDERVAGRAAFYWPRLAEDTKLGLDEAQRVDYSCFAGAAALVSTPGDLVRFGSAVLAGEAARPATIALLQEPFRLTDGTASAFGLGWRVDARPEGHAVGRDSSPVGGTASLRLLPVDGVAVAVAANVTFAKGVAPLAATLADLFAAPPPTTRP